MGVWERKALEIYGDLGKRRHQNDLSGSKLVSEWRSLKGNGEGNGWETDLKGC